MPLLRSLLNHGLKDIEKNESYYAKRWAIFYTLNLIFAPMMIRKKLCWYSKKFVPVDQESKTPLKHHESLALRS